MHSRDQLLMSIFQRCLSERGVHRCVWLIITSSFPGNGVEAERIHHFPSFSLDLFPPHIDTLCDCSLGCPSVNFCGENG